MMHLIIDEKQLTIVTEKKTAKSKLINHNLIFEQLAATDSIFNKAADFETSIPQKSYFLFS